MLSRNPVRRFVELTSHRFARECFGAKTRRRLAFATRLLLVASLLCGSADSASAAVIMGWDFSTLAGGSNSFGPSPYAPGTTVANITAGGLTRGSGIGTTGSGAADAWGGNNLTATSEAAAITAGDYATFSVTANTGYSLSLSDIGAYNIRRSTTGPTTGIWQYSTNGTAFTDIGSAITWGSTTSSSGNAETSINLSGIGTLQSVAAGTTVTFRVVSWAQTASGGTWYFNDPTKTTANDLILDGTVAAGSTPAAFGAISATPASTSIITGGSTGFSFTVQNSAASGANALNFTAAAGTNVTGTVSSGTVAANSTSSPFSGFTFDGTTVGAGQTGSFTLTDTGASNSPATGSVSVNVFGHANAALAVASGNNQTIITGGALGAVTLNLTDTGTYLSALDVNTLSNLSGSTGTAVVANGGTGTYTATGFDTTTVGQNKTLATSLKAGDQQSLSGASALGTLGQSVTYSVLGHSNAVLGITSGNNQSIITGGALGAVTLNLTDAGTNLSALDVNTLSNLSGSTGTAVVANGGAGTYTATGFDTTTVGQNKTLPTSLKAGDQQSMSGASALGTLNQSVTYSVYGHASGSVSSGTLTVPDVIVGYSAAQTSNSVNVSNASGFLANLKTTNNGSLNSLSLGNVSAVAPNASAAISATLATGKGVGAYSQPFTLTYADDSALSGASTNVGTQAITVQGNVYDHASPSASGTTIVLPDTIAGFNGMFTALGSLTVSNASGFRSDLKTTGTTSAGYLAIANVSSISAGGDDTISAGANLDGTQPVGPGRLTGLLP